MDDRVYIYNMKQLKDIIECLNIVYTSNHWYLDPKIITFNDLRKNYGANNYKPNHRFIERNI